MGQVTVQFLGSGDLFGSGGRLQTCIFVDAGHTRFLLDCGTSALIGMRRWQVNPSNIETILITHLHGDHFGGLPFFLLEAQLVSKRVAPLTIAGPPGVGERTRQAMALFFPGSEQMRPNFNLQFVELPPHQPTWLGRLLVTPYPVVHPSGAPAYALRVECGGKTIAYSGDTGWTDSLISAAAQADLFICEAYFYDKKVKYHLDYQTLLAHGSALTCRRMMITHLSQELLDRLDSLQLEPAYDGKRVVLSSQ